MCIYEGRNFTCLLPLPKIEHWYFAGSFSSEKLWRFCRMIIPATVYLVMTVSLPLTHCPESENRTRYIFKFGRSWLNICTSCHFQCQMFVANLRWCPFQFDHCLTQCRWCPFEFDPLSLTQCRWYPFEIDPLCLTHSVGGALLNLTCSV